MIHKKGYIIYLRLQNVYSKYRKVNFIYFEIKMYPVGSISFRAGAI